MIYSLIDDEQIKEQLSQLRNEHRTLDESIDSMIREQKVDMIRLSQMKKHKLSLKDQIAKLEGMLFPDMPA